MRLQRTVPVLPRRFVVEHQKRRAAEALAELCREKGWEAVTVAMVCSRAQMSRTTFYSHFSGLAGCGAYTNDDSFSQICGSLLRDPEGEGPIAQLESTLAAFFLDLASRPALAEFCLVHSLSASEDLKESSHELTVEAAQSRISGFFDAVTPVRDRSLATISEGLSRAMVRQAAGKLRRSEAEEIPGLESIWMRLIGGYLPSAVFAPAPSSSGG